jgi:hypothetical protein
MDTAANRAGRGGRGEFGDTHVSHGHRNIWVIDIAMITGYASVCGVMKAAVVTLPPGAREARADSSGVTASVMGFPCADTDRSTVPGFPGRLQRYAPGAD